MRFFSFYSVPFLVAALLLSACGEEDLGNNDGTKQGNCLAQERLNPITGQCETIPGHENGEEQANSQENGSENTNPGENGADPANQGNNDPDPGNQQNPTNQGGPQEYCGLDMNPDFEIDCSFYAHTPEMLYRIDPFRKTIETIRAVPSGLTDIDTHPEGTLYGITFDNLYKLEVGATDWAHVGTLNPSSTANGLCIDMGGNAFMTAGSDLYRLDLTTAQVTHLTSFGGLFSSISSSGDCVFDKGDRLFMSSRGAGMTGADDLVAIDGQNTRVIGNTGFAQIYGLTSAWGILFGTTGQGEVIRINSDTGRADLLFKPPGNLNFYGAASTPAR